MIDSGTNGYFWLIRTKDPRYTWLTSFVGYGCVDEQENVKVEHGLIAFGSREQCAAFISRGLEDLEIKQTFGPVPALNWHMYKATPRELAKIIKDHEFDSINFNLRLGDVQPDDPRMCFGEAETLERLEELDEPEDT